jgi:PIN domain nuclease of toxin-antitoxin system
MIVLDTHVWIWWTLDTERLSDAQRRVMEDNEGDLIGVSAISCWEVAKLCEYRRLELPVELSEWFATALGYPGVSLLGITPEVAVESTRLPSGFHRDPADQIIVATARVHACDLVTSDKKIVKYPHVRTVN